MSNARRNPFRGFLDVMSEMNRMQHQWMAHRDSEHPNAGRSHATAWIPPADIFATKEDLVIRCEVSGLRREDVEISISNGVLTISGERNSELDEKNVTYYTRERSYGPFRRSMILPDGVDVGDVTASFDNGLLQITVKGGASARVHRVAIAGGE